MATTVSSGAFSNFSHFLIFQSDDVRAENWSPPSANTSRNCSSLEAMSGSFFKVGAKKLFGSVETTWSLKSVRTVAPLPLHYFKRRLRSYCWKNIFFETQKRDWNLLRVEEETRRRTNLLLFAWSSFKEKKMGGHGRVDVVGNWLSSKIGTLFHAIWPYYILQAFKPLQLWITS